MLISDSISQPLLFFQLWLSIPSSICSPQGMIFFIIFINFLLSYKYSALTNDNQQFLSLFCHLHLHIDLVNGFLLFCPLTLRGKNISRLKVLVKAQRYVHIREITSGYLFFMLLNIWSPVEIVVSILQHEEIHPSFFIISDAIN